MGSWRISERVEHHLEKVILRMPSKAEIGEPVERDRVSKSSKLGSGLVMALLLLGLLPSPAAAYPRPGITERVSVSSDGTEGDATSFQPAISADNRYVSFDSESSDLVPGDTNEAWDVFVYDRVTRALERVSVSSDGTEGDANSFNSDMSADGRYVAFQSFSSNLVPGDTNAAWDVGNDVFVHDRITGVTERVSVASDGSEAVGVSYQPAISADGRHVAFQSSARNLVSGDTNNAYDVFVHDRSTGVTERVSVASDGSEANGVSYQPDISADGRHVAFESPASNLVPGDTRAYDVFVHDRATGETERVSVASDGSEAFSTSFHAAISGDGGHVAFYSHASNLVPGDNNGVQDVFVHDRARGVTERVSVAPDGTQANSYSGGPALSADGRHVAFPSAASNLVPGDTNGAWDVFVHDRQTGSTDRVSVASGGDEADFGASSSAISADGGHVAFTSSARNLVSGDTNKASDIFVHERGGSLDVVGELSAVHTPGGVAVSGRAVFSGAVMTSASDPARDVGGPIGGTAGADLTGASVTYRPEHEDLLVTLRVTSLPALNGVAPELSFYYPSLNNGAGAPTVLYGLRFILGASRYEVRALRAATADLPAAPTFTLSRCDPACTEAAVLTGGIGTIGSSVSVSVSLSALDVEEGATLGEIAAFTALGEEAPGPLVVLDEADLPVTTIPIRRVLLGIAPAGTPQPDVSFDVAATLGDGDFAGTVPTAGLSPGSYRVWARSCLGDPCGPAASGDVAL